MKKEEIIISTAKTNTDKYNTYTFMITRHKEAVKHGFCFEALLIDYAILEDRLVAFLWAAGVMNDMDNFSFGTEPLPPKGGRFNQRLKPPKVG